MKILTIKSLADLPRARMFEEFSTTYDTLDTAVTKFERRNGYPPAVAYVYAQPTALHGQLVTKFYLGAKE